MGACFENRYKNKNRNLNVVPSLKESCEIESPNNNIEIINSPLSGRFEKKTPSNNIKVNNPIIEQSLPESFELKTPNNNEEAAKPIIVQSLPQIIGQKTSNNDAEAAKPIRVLNSPDNSDKNKTVSIIKMRFKIEQQDVNKPVKILYNMKNVIPGCNLRELTDKNTKLYIGNKKTKYQSYFIPEKEGIYDIELKINIRLKSCCGLFYDLYYLQKVDLSSFDAQDAVDMSYMFFNCTNLSNINLSSFSAPKVTNMSYMFAQCSNLQSANLSSFNAPNVINMDYLFYNCNNLKSVNLSSFNAKNIKSLNISRMFSSCNELISINLSSFNAQSITDISKNV